MTHLKTVAFPIALAALLSAQPLATAGDVEKKTEQTAQDLKEIKEGLKEGEEVLRDPGRWLGSQETPRGESLP